MTKRKSSARKRATPVKRYAVFASDLWSIGSSSSGARSLAKKKIKPAKRRPSANKPAKRRPSAKLVAGARDYVLDAYIAYAVLYDTAAGLLTARERLDLIATLREDLDLRQSEIEYAIEARRRQRAPRKVAGRRQRAPRKVAA